METATHKPAKRKRCRFTVGNRKERNPSECSGNDAKKPLESISYTNWKESVWVMVYGSVEGPVADSCKHGNEISDSKKCGHF